MPIAMRALERSTGKTAKELLKMMELGQLGAEYLVPFMDALGEIANQGGAVTKAMQTAATQEKRFINQSKLAANTIFRSGFEEGLVNLYQTLTKIFENSEEQFQKIGRGFKMLFDGIAYGFKLIEPVFRFAIDNFELLFGFFAAGKITMAIAALEKLQIGLARAFFPLTAALAVAEELISLVSDEVVGTLEQSMGKQINLMTGTTQGLEFKDGQYYAQGEKKQMSLFGMEYLDTFNTARKYASMYQPLSFLRPESKADNLSTATNTTSSTVVNDHRTIHATFDSATEFEKYLSRQNYGR